MVTAVAAAEFARTSLEELVGAGVVGDHVDVLTEGDAVETHRFANAHVGYPGWFWAVTLVLVNEAEPTINEIVLLPGDEAILAPQWVPWRDRILPGDMSPGDILPVDEDDVRLVPGYFAGDEQQPPVDRQTARALTDEVGLGRQRVLSPEGRAQAAERWYSGVAGPNVPIAQSAPGKCGNCGFLVQLAGPMSTMFGVCANAFANDDGRVVSLDHGCGAHSGAQLRRKQLPAPPPDPVFDTVSRDDLENF